MKFQNKYFVSVFLAITLLSGWVTPAYAAIVISVIPGSVVNDVENTITVAGSDFDPTAVVLLNGAALTTNFLNNQTLTAIVPVGFTPNSYTVTVTMTNVVVNGSSTLIVSAPFTPTPTSTIPSPTITSIPSAFSRPQLVINSYKANVSTVQTGKEFKIKIGFDNAGTSNAINAQAAFTSTDLIPTKTGGVVAIGAIPAGGNGETSQTFLAVDSVYGKSFVIVDVALTYYDGSGAAYTDKFTLNIPAGGGTGGGGVAYPTSTPTGVNTAQLVITSYASTVDPLQPGEQFQLGMTVQNMGTTPAKSVTMIVGGGSSGSGGGTPQPGGVSGGSGEFTNFAPVGSSNIQSLGDFPSGGALQVKQNLIVNVSTNPGAYPMKITFSYVNNKGEVVNDDQVITLLVYSLPNLDVSFYRPLDPFFVGQPGALPIQIVNLGKRSTVLGNMKIESTGGTLDPASTLVGSLDPGGYFTFDAMLFPDAAGPLDLTVTIDYTDDFNKPRAITRKLSLNVEEFLEPEFDPTQAGMDFAPIPEESFFQKAWRFVLGVFGLDSAPADNGVPMEAPGIEQIPMPLPSGGGKGG